MPNDFEAKIIQDFTRDIAGKLHEAAAIARMADGFSKQDLAERAFQTLLDISPLVHDASILLNASSIVRRRERERGIDRVIDAD